MEEPATTHDGAAQRSGGIGSVLRVLLLVVLLLVLAGVAFVGGLVARSGPLAGLLGDGEVVESGATVVTGIRALAELTTVEAVEYVTVTAADDRGILDFALGDEVQLLAVARVRAGVDLSALGPGDVDVDEETNAVRVELPAPAIQAVALDNDATQVYSRDTGLLTRGDDQLETRARQQAEQLLREQALDAGLLERAGDEAVAAVTELLDALGFAEVEVTVAG